MLIAGGAILLVIAYMTLLGLLMADRGRSGTPVNLAAGAGEALGSLVTYLTQHPAEYYWSRQLWPAAEQSSIPDKQ